jgi:hypothetical protein
LQSLVMWLVVLHFMVGGGSYNKIWLLNRWSSLYSWPLLWWADGYTAGHCFGKLMVVQLATALTSWWWYSWPVLWQADGCTAGHCFEGLMVVQLATV